MISNRDCIKIIVDKKEKRGINTSKLAERAGIPVNTLSRIITGKQRLKADELVNLSRELHLTIDDFIGQEAS